MTQKEKQGISAAIALKMGADYKVTDNSDLMRLHMLGMSITDLENPTVETIKETIGFRTISSNFNVTDEYLQELIDTFMPEINKNEEILEILTQESGGARYKITEISEFLLQIFYNTYGDKFTAEDVIKSLPVLFSLIEEETKVNLITYFEE